MLDARCQIAADDSATMRQCCHNAVRSYRRHRYEYRVSGGWVFCENFQAINQKSGKGQRAGSLGYGSNLCGRDLIGVCASWSCVQWEGDLGYRRRLDRRGDKACHAKKSVGREHIAFQSTRHQVSGYGNGNAGVEFRVSVGTVAAFVPRR